MRHEAHGGAEARADLVEGAVAAVRDHRIGLLEQGRGVMGLVAGEGGHLKCVGELGCTLDRALPSSRRGNTSSSEEALASTGQPKEQRQGRPRARRREHVARQNQRTQLHQAAPGGLAHGAAERRARGRASFLP